MSVQAVTDSFIKTAGTQRYRLTLPAQSELENNNKQQITTFALHEDYKLLHTVSIIIQDLTHKLQGDRTNTYNSHLNVKIFYSRSWTIFLVTL